MRQITRRQMMEKNRLGTCTDLPSPAVDELVTLRNLLRKPTGIELSQLNQDLYPPVRNPSNSARIQVTPI